MFDMYVVFFTAVDVYDFFDGEDDRDVVNDSKKPTTKVNEFFWLIEK